MEILFKISAGLERAGPDGRAVIDCGRGEISLYRAHPGVYGYEFSCFRRGPA